MLPKSLFSTLNRRGAVASAPMKIVEGKITMRTIVIAGGTDGIGRELALQLLRNGEHVIIIGRSSEKGEELRLEAARLDGEDRFLFLQADLSPRL